MRSLVAVLLVISGALFTVAAEQPSNPMSTTSVDSPPSEPAIILKATTRMVLLDVVAVDKQGNPVTDLKAADFTVLEKGREQKIGSFAFEQPAPASAGSAFPAAMSLPPNVFSNVQFTQLPKALNVILLDGLNTTMPSQMLVRQQMIKFLETMPPGQPVAVYTLRRNLRLLQDFTSDSELLRKVAKEYIGYRSEALDNATGGPKEVVVSPDAIKSQMFPPGLLAALQGFLARETALAMDYRSHRTAEALQALARNLAGYPGRKNLIWISESFPLRFFPGIGLGNENLSRDSDQTSDALADAQVAVYPIDAAGLVASGIGAMDASYDELGTKENLGNRHPRGTAYGDVLAGQFEQMTGTHSIMDELAARTGGKAFYNRNDLHTAIQRGITDGSSYYLVGYYPSDKNWNGKFRRLQVKVNRSGVNLRYRAGYYALDRQSYGKDSGAQSRDLSAAMSLSDPPSTTLFFSATLTLPSARTANKLVVDYSIDGRSISFEEGEDGLRHASLGCYVQAYNEDGKPIKAVSQLPLAALKEATYRRVLSEGFPCTTTMDLPAGSYQLRFAVRDERTGLIGTANGKVTIP